MHRLSFHPFLFFSLLIAILLSDVKDTVATELLEQTKTHYREQHLEKALAIYLKALEDIPSSKEAYVASIEEERVYQEALAIYLNSQLLPQEATAKIWELYREELQRPSYFKLKFLWAATLANHQNFLDFFQVFYEAYEKDPSHYLAQKIKAVLHLMLLEKEPLGEVKTRRQELILSLIDQCIQKEPRDYTLYKMGLKLASGDKSERMFVAYLNKIIDHNIVVPRADIYFFVQKAIAYEKIDLAKQFLDQAKNWYSSSRVISQAEDLLNEKRKG